MVKNPPGGRPGLDPLVGKIPWRRECQPTPIFLPGEFHGQRSLVSPWGHKESDTIEWQTHTHRVWVWICSLSISQQQAPRDPEKTLTWVPQSLVQVFSKEMRSGKSEDLAVFIVVVELWPPGSAWLSGAWALIESLVLDGNGSSGRQEGWGSDGKILFLN